MSTGQQGQATQQAGATTAASRVDGFIKMIAATKDQPRLRFVSGVCRLDIEGAGSWRVEVKEGAVAVSEARNDTSPVNVVITTTADVMARILVREGNLNFVTALLQEIATVSGDPAFALDVIGGVTFDQAALDAR